MNSNHSTLLIFSTACQIWSQFAYHMIQSRALYTMTMYIFSGIRPFKLQPIKSVVGMKPHITHCRSWFNWCRLFLKWKFCHTNIVSVKNEIIYVGLDILCFAKNCRSKRQASIFFILFFFFFFSFFHQIASNSFKQLTKQQDNFIYLFIFCINCWAVNTSLIFLILNFQIYLPRQRGLEHANYIPQQRSKTFPIPTKKME